MSLRSHIDIFTVHVQYEVTDIKKALFDYYIIILTCKADLIRAQHSVSIYVNQRVMQ